MPLTRRSFLLGTSAASVWALFVFDGKFTTERWYGWTAKHGWKRVVPPSLSNRPIYVGEAAHA